jgi:ABC-type phosphate/phosphonate transport system permease subunit
MAAVERHVAKLSMRLTPWRIALRFLLITAIAGLGPFVSSPLIGAGGSRDMDWVRADLWSTLAVSLGFGAMLGGVVVFATLHPSFRDVSRVAKRVERDWRYLTEGRWAVRVAVWGVLVGCAVGVPIGILLANSMQPDELAETGGRLGAVIIFVGMTFLWAVPAAYVFRFMILRSLRPLVLAED